VAPGSRGLPQCYVILDGMNILRSRNAQGLGDDMLRLEWGQLESACGFYTRRRLCISVFLPTLRHEHYPDLERLRSLFGDIFVLCPGGGSCDDKFMINAVKTYEEDLSLEADVDHRSNSDGKRPSCYIVTNDAFRDWQQMGCVDAAWVDEHCIRFAFCALGFVPSKLL